MTSNGTRIKGRKTKTTIFIGSVFLPAYQVHPIFTGSRRYKSEGVNHSNQITKTFVNDLSLKGILLELFCKL